MEQAARQLARAIRGTRSQVAFSRRLGYRGNVAAEWEAGRRKPTADKFFAACRRMGIQVEQAFARFHRSPPPGRGPEALAHWLHVLRGSTSTTEIARRLGVSRSTVSRWFGGRAQPRIHEFLQLVEAITGRACDLVAELVPIETVPALEQAYYARAAARRLAHEEPWTEAILRVLEFRAYDPAQIATQLGIAESTVIRAVDKLILSGVVTRNASKPTALEVSGELTVDTRAASELKGHWAEVARKRLTAPLDDDLFSYNVFSVSRADLGVIRERLQATYREIRALVAESKHADQLALVNLQLVGFPEGAVERDTGLERGG
jgi:transcriptional regulator with XRE-family HTH domain